MRFFKSLKGDHPSHVGGDADGSAGPSGGDASPPAHAPPKKEREQQHERGYGSAAGDANWTASQPPPYHDWQQVPDTALLPPPPALSNTYSPTGNASDADARRAHEWCARYPLILPHQPTEAQVAAVQQGRIELQRPREYAGTLRSPEPGVWMGATRANAPDCALISGMPLYFEQVHSPYRTERAKTIYFEVTLRRCGGHRADADDNALAIGFCSVPYPTWRMPGWERGSLGVHSDDGRRYVNDTDGGVDFTAPFSPGETIGLGIHFALPDRPQDFAPDPAGGRPLKGRVFLTRNGVESGSWDVQEERDAESEFGTLGVDGKYDLYAAVGLFGQIEFEVNFQPQHWMWNP